MKFHGDGACEMLGEAKLRMRVATLCDTHGVDVQRTCRGSDCTKDVQHQDAGDNVGDKMSKHLSLSAEVVVLNESTWTERRALLPTDVYPFGGWEVQDRARAQRLCNVEISRCGLVPFAFTFVNFLV